MVCSAGRSVRVEDDPGVERERTFLEHAERVQVDFFDLRNVEYQLRYRQDSLHHSRFVEGLPSRAGQRCGHRSARQEGAGVGGVQRGKFVRHLLERLHVDAAVTARESGAEAVIAYRGSELKAQPHEQRRAQEAGVGVRFRAVPTAVVGTEDDLRVELSEGEAEPASAIILAIGQETDSPFLRKLGLEVRPDGTTNRPTVFVAGGTKYGSDRLAKAIQDGRLAAQTILKDH